MRKTIFNMKEDTSQVKNNLALKKVKKLHGYIGLKVEISSIFSVISREIT